MGALFLHSVALCRCFKATRPADVQLRQLPIREGPEAVSALISLEPTIHTWNETYFAREESIRNDLYQYRISNEPIHSLEARCHDLPQSRRNILLSPGGRCPWQGPTRRIPPLIRARWLRL